MSDAAWKATERAIAKRLHGRRVGPSGTSTADVDAGWLVAECKHRKALPEWIKDALRQATNAAGGGKLGVAILHESGKRHDDDVVVMRLLDFQEWFADQCLDTAEPTGYNIEKQAYQQA